MRAFLLSLGWFGNIVLIVPALILIFAQWAPESWLPFAGFIPSDMLLKYALWGAIICAVLVPLSLLKGIANEEETSVWTWIKYIVLFVLSVVFGGILGYAGTIKGGYVLGNTLMIENLTDSSPQVITIEEKEHNTVPSRYNYCEYSLKTAIGKGDIAWYEKYFLPSDLCVTKDVYDDTEKEQSIFLLGKGNEQFGFFIDKVLTENDLKKLKNEGNDTAEENESELEDGEEIEETEGNTEADSDDGETETQ